MHEYEDGQPAPVAPFSATAPPCSFAQRARFAAVVAIAGPATTGAELVLEQQQRALDRLTLPAAERERRVAIQKQLQAAVLTGRGWDSIPADLRKQADTPWFQSLLAFNPARVIRNVRQPLLFIHGDLDRQVPVAHAEVAGDRLGRERADPLRLLHLSGERLEGG